MNALPCHVCDGFGWVETCYDGRVTCRNCDGTGNEPPHAAGDRYTGPKPAIVIDGFRKFRGDALELLQIARTHENREWYAKVRRDAMRPKTMQLAQADMLARAAMCVTASDRAVAAWREVA